MSVETVDTSTGLFVPADDKLKCSRCSDYMIPPIYICLSGHNSCEDCKHAFPCKICKAPIGIRNCELEKRTCFSSYTCKWCADCSNLTSRTVRPHETACSFRYFRCPFSGCEEAFRYSGITNHLAEIHHVSDYRLSNNRRGHVDRSHQWVMMVCSELFACYFTTYRNEFKWTVQHHLPYSRVQEFKIQLEFFRKVHQLQPNDNEFMIEIKLNPTVKLKVVDYAYTLSVLETSRYLDNIVW